LIDTYTDVLNRKADVQKAMKDMKKMVENQRKAGREERKKRREESAALMMNIPLRAANKKYAIAFSLYFSHTTGFASSSSRSGEQSARLLTQQSLMQSQLQPLRPRPIRRTRSRHLRKTL
jgi:hypothetical protein